MSYIEKLFEQYPFVYCLEEEYYVFGTSICGKVAGQISNIEYKYKRYKSALEKELTRQDALQIFRSVVNEAIFISECQGFKVNTKKRFSEFKFNQNQIVELEKQIKEYVSFFQKYKLDDYYIA